MKMTLSSLISVVFNALLIRGLAAAVCTGKQTLELTDNRYPPGTNIYVNCPSNSGKTVSTCSRGIWRPTRPLIACKSFNSSDGDSYSGYEEYLENGMATDGNIVSNWCSWPKSAPKMYPSGVNITVECPFGYGSAGISNVSRSLTTCSKNGTWTQELANCTSVKPNPCTLPTTPRNGRIYSRSPNIAGTAPGLLMFTRGSFIRYECFEGYTLYGPARINCLADGDWSSNPPRCEKILLSQ